MRSKKVLAVAAAAALGVATMAKSPTAFGQGGGMRPGGPMIGSTRPGGRMGPMSPGGPMIGPTRPGGPMGPMSPGGPMMGPTRPGAVSVISRRLALIQLGDV